MVCRIIHDGPCDSDLNADCWRLNILCAFAGLILCNDCCVISFFDASAY